MVLEVYGRYAEQGSMAVTGSTACKLEYTGIKKE